MTANIPRQNPSSPARTKRASANPPARGTALPKRGRRTTPTRAQPIVPSVGLARNAGSLAGGSERPLDMNAAEAELRALGELAEEAPDAADFDPDMMAVEGLEAGADGQSGVRMAMQGLDKKLRASGKTDAELAADQTALFARMREELERKTGGLVGPVRMEDVTEVYR
jgi:hypothetical protein